MFEKLLLPSLKAECYLGNDKGLPYLFYSHHRTRKQASNKQFNRKYDWINDYYTSFLFIVI